MSVSKEKLHEAMQGCPSTASWDVLVSYSEDKLNRLLAKQWGKSPTFKELSFDVFHRKGTPKEYSTHYDIKLGSPTLQFQSKKSEPVATLVMSIEGSKYDSDLPDQVQKIEPGYFSLAVHVLLTNMPEDHEVNHDVRSISRVLFLIVTDAYICARALKTQSVLTTTWRHLNTLSSISKTNRTHGN